MGQISEGVVGGTSRATTRDKWNAFHRLYRLATKQTCYHEMGAVETLCILFPYRWVSLMEKDANTFGRSGMPKFIRRQLLEGDRKKRLYDWNHRTKQECQNTARKLAERGVECTPDEVAEVRYKVLKMIRERAAFPLPASDQQLMDNIRRAKS